MSIWWEICQHNHFVETGSPYHSSSWAQKMIKALWSTMWSLWDNRNYAKHHTLTAVRQEAISELHQHITTQYHNGIHDLLPDEHVLFDLPLDNLLECAWDYKQRWLESVHAGRKRYQHHQQQHDIQRNLNPSRELFRNWLQV